jgi:hypothetical protein
MTAASISKRCGKILMEKGELQPLLLLAHGCDTIDNDIGMDIIDDAKLKRFYNHLHFKDLFDKLL